MAAPYQHVISRSSAALQATSALKAKFAAAEKEDQLPAYLNLKEELNDQKLIATFSRFNKVGFLDAHLVQKCCIAKRNAFLHPRLILRRLGQDFSSS